ncbi:MAG TPA: hypothetical protein VM033_04490 [Gemmatimonadaceae bacterium]|nr:hypothetical protein [Gemmatimonadaceae bacterium]
MRLLHVTLMLAVAALCGCTTTGTRSSDGAPILGRWGGAHAELTLTETGGTISYDCGHGGVGAPVTPDRAGDFNVSGVHVREHGGPVRIGEVPDSLPARYVGHVSGDRMTLRVLVGLDTLGPFDLRLGTAPQIVRCL